MYPNKLINNFSPSQLMSRINIFVNSFVLYCQTIKGLRYNQRFPNYININCFYNYQKLDINHFWDKKCKQEIYRFHGI